jgi:hypothetical protein
MFGGVLLIVEYKAEIVLFFGTVQKKPNNIMINPG